ncbi:LemA family protein [Patulibacter minatonensis]|uniref:LemA family protein n=1 Tax=Patulibacter minatonensis TaxID=298163 RepID=UPI00047BDF4F|nr:LemA family protein [Patulibacter minatonensis]
MVVVIVVVVVLVLVGLAWALVYNGLIGARNRVDEAWSGIDVQLKRRHDLVPNLVAAVKGYAAHEQATFQAVTDARAKAIAAQGPVQTAAAENELSSRLVDVRAVAEGYPELRATENFQQLQVQLTQLEDEIQASRRLYNGNVQHYDTKRQIFPNSIVAARGPFPAKPLFELADPETERATPQVSF